MDGQNGLEELDGWDEVTTQLTVNLEQLDALLISCTESMISCQERIDYFNSPIAKVQILEKYPELTPDEVDEKIEGQIALAESLLETYPTLMEAMKEIYPELEKKEETKSTIQIVQPSWRGR